VVQEAYLRVWRFRASLPAGDAARAWLYRVLVNSAIGQLRRERPRRAAALVAGARRSTEPPPRSPELAAVDAEATAAILAALADLPEHLRVPVVLRYWSGLSEREIATAVQRRPGTVKSRLHEAKRRLAADARLAPYAPTLAEGGSG
jgi:RNA polymerase sigma-70 factor (ECF subfamily)